MFIVRCMVFEKIQQIMYCVAKKGLVSNTYMKKPGNFDVETFCFFKQSE
jgi:hypothetical protein